MLFRLSRPAWCLLAGLLVVSMTACAPSLSPLYRDYEVQASPEAASEGDTVRERIEAALAEAGWQTAPGSVPNVVATEERKISDWGLYTVVVSLEVAPIGEGYVRLYAHPYRHYFTGGRSKIPYLKKSLERALLDDLNPALQRQGLQAIGTAMQRDRQAAAR